MRLRRLGAAILGIGLSVGATAAAPINVVVAEDVYADAVRAVAGPNAAVTEILNGPTADPHDFEPTPSVARAVADADVVIFNGLGYDPWMDRLIAASPATKRTALSVGTILGRRDGDNPHLWYDPTAMPALIDAVVAALAAADPAGAAGYSARGAGYRNDLAAIGKRIDAVRARHAGAPVTATEPVAAYLSDALGLDMRHDAFQRAIMSETEPSARDIAAIESDLKAGTVRALFYNAQVADDLTRHLLSLARAANVPVVGVSETLPQGQSYVGWMLDMIGATEKALAARRN